VNELYNAYTEQEIEDDQMFNFIRDEWLNMIIARKQYVKDSKVRLKEEREQKARDRQKPPMEEE